MEDQPIHVGFAIDVIDGDALEVQGDILLLIDWRGRSNGLDDRIYHKLKAQGAKFDNSDYHLFDNHGLTATDKIFFVGPPGTRRPGPEQLRQFTINGLAILKDIAPHTEHIVTNVKAVLRGLDERQAFVQMLLGINDAYEAGDYPPALRLITFVEKSYPRAELFKHALDDYLPETTVIEAVTQARDDIGNLIGQITDEARRTITKEKPHIFVAMPFSEAYDDQYYLAVYPAVHESEHFCIRLDQAESAFTGNILTEIKEQIDKAELVIALLDSGNPNVYLEVGYAWGKGIPTVLCIHEDEDVPFDVRGERLIVYKHIYKLKQDLSQELQMVLKRRKRH